MRVLCNRDVSNEDNQCRFKVGDRVRIKNDLSGTNNHVYLARKMKELVSKKATIIEVLNIEGIANNKLIIRYQVVRINIDNGDYWWEGDSFNYLDEDWD